MKWLKCVPNFSEGRNPEVLEGIAKAIRSVQGVQLLHVDPGFDANRTVYTFAGPPEAVVEAAYRAILYAAEKIDMQQHSGEHPRMGACDVCPFIPLGEMTTDEAIPLIEQLSERLGDAGISGYLYELSARDSYRKNLATLRKGEYESLPNRLLQAFWKPDFGPSTFQPKFGAMVLGVRPFLVAYNVNLSTKEVSLAKKIAVAVRESGFKNSDGFQIPGKLKGVKAIGWWMEAYQCAQVSTNIVDIEQVSIKQVYDEINQEAQLLGISAKGSELIGLIPEKVLVKAGEEILGKTSCKTDYIESAIEYLGLNIRPEERILEQVLENRASR